MSPCPAALSAQCQQECDVHDGNVPISLAGWKCRRITFRTFSSSSHCPTLLALPYVSGVQILLVEDDRDLRRFLSKAFREEGYGVTETDSATAPWSGALEEASRASCST